MKTTVAVVSCCVAAFGAIAQMAPPNARALGACGAGITTPARVAVGPAGEIYVVDAQAGRVTRFDSFFRPVAQREELGRPLGLAVDGQGRIYVADELTGSVSVFDANWNRLYKLGAGDGEFQMPNHIALAQGAAVVTVYVTDSLANQVKIFADQSRVGQLGGPGAGSGQFDFPAGICVSAQQEVFVVDQGNDRVQVFDAEGSFIRAFSLGGSSADPSGRSQAASIDTLGRIYVADSFQGIVKVFDAASGAPLSNLGSFGHLPGELNSPAGLAMDTFNRLFIASAGTRRVEVYGLDSFLHVVMEPLGDVFAAGTNLVLKAVTGGPGTFTYQWRKDGHALEGATEATLALAALDSTHVGAYSVVVTGPGGAVTSDAAQLMVLAPPSITASPGDQTVMKGSNVLFQVAARGDNLSFQWYLNGLPVQGAVGGSLELPGVQLHQAGSYSVVVSNPVGTVRSSAALLTILVPPTTAEIVAGGVEPDGNFRLTLNADPGFNYSLDASGDFLGWDSLGNFSNESGLVEFIDTDATNWVNRFYRIRWVP